MKPAFDNDKIQARIKEIEDDLISKFSPEFKDKIKHHNLHSIAFRLLCKGASPYRVLEQVMDDLIESLKHRNDE